MANLRRKWIFNRGEKTKVKFPARPDPVPTGSGQVGVNATGACAPAPAKLRQRAPRFGCKLQVYGFGFSEVGFSWADLSVAALGFEAGALAMTTLGCQKSAATLTISSAGLLSSGEKR